MGVLLFGLAVIAGWMATAWRAFGDWNGLSGLRTAGALVLFLVVGYGVSHGLVLAPVGYRYQTFLSQALEG